MDGVPMPGEFSLYHFNQGASGIEKSNKEQVKTLVWWVVGKNKLWGMLEVLAIKYPFAAGVGRDINGHANQANGHMAVDLSALGLIKALKNLPYKIEEKVSPLMLPYFTAWAAEAAQPNTFRSAVGAFNFGTFSAGVGDLLQRLVGNNSTGPDEDKAIYADMAPEGRLSMVLSLIENTYAIEIKLIQGQFPLINLFDVYLQAGVEGRAGSSIHSMASR